MQMTILALILVSLHATLTIHGGPTRILHPDIDCFELSQAFSPNAYDGQGNRVAKAPLGGLLDLGGSAQDEDTSRIIQQAIRDHGQVDLALGCTFTLSNGTVYSTTINLADLSTAPRDGGQDGDNSNRFAARTVTFSLNPAGTSTRGFNSAFELYLDAMGDTANYTDLNILSSTPSNLYGLDLFDLAGASAQAPVPPEVTYSISANRAWRGGLELFNLIDDESYDPNGPTSHAPDPENPFLPLDFQVNGSGLSLDPWIPMGNGLERKVSIHVVEGATAAGGSATQTAWFDYSPGSGH